MDPSPDFLSQLPGLGIGGILAAGLGWLLNRAWKEHAETIKGFHEIEKGRTDLLVTVVRENSVQTAVNTNVLNSLHRRLDKDAAEREGK